MGPEEVRRLYDADYAASYDAKFLTADNVAPDTAFELQVIGDLLKSEPEWLDVACGTGYYFRHFQHIRRTGLDLSPAMLDQARQGNSGVDFFEGDFRQARPEWAGRFGLVSCMWYAYTMVDTVAEIVKLIDNLADWTSPSGACFLPLADARLLARRDLPYHVDDAFPGQTIITGILWSYVEGGKVHSHCVTPQLEFMVEQFERRFENVDVIRYPHKANGVVGRPALLATNKK